MNEKVELEEVNSSKVVHSLYVQLTHCLRGKKERNCGAGRSEFLKGCALTVGGALKAEDDELFDVRVFPDHLHPHLADRFVAQACVQQPHRLLEGQGVKLGVAQQSRHQTPVGLP